MTNNHQKPNDTDLVNHIKDLLHKKMQASSMDINVYSKNGNVQLTGIVDLYAEKKEAEKITKDINGVRSVTNSITIGMDSSITDKHIELEVLDKLSTSNNEKVRGVGAKVSDGSVTLMGKVNTLKEAHMAMELAGENRGVKDVVSNLDIQSVGDHTDTYINNKILQELSKTDLSFRDVHREVSGGVVTLFGYLNNSHEMEMAVEITKGIEGVKKVINKLKARNK